MSPSSKTSSQGDGSDAAKKPWHSSVVTLFPEMFPGPLGHSLAGQALKKKIWTLETHAIREFGLGKHRSVDDTPAGGGAGLVMRADVLAPALDAAIESNPLARRIYLSPRGKPLTQTMAKSLSQEEGVVFLAGRFEGVDQRIIDAYQLEELSIGDYVLSGGELAAMVVLDAIIRLLPGAIGSEESLNVESFEAGLLEHPHYTKPRLWNGREIPEVLLSGDHGKVEQWRREQALALTKKRRPDLLAKKS